MDGGKEGEGSRLERRRRGEGGTQSKGGRVVGEWLPAYTPRTRSGDVAADHSPRLPHTELAFTLITVPSEPELILYCHHCSLTPTLYSHLCIQASMRASPSRLTSPTSAIPQPRSLCPSRSRCPPVAGIYAGGGEGGAYEGATKALTGEALTGAEHCLLGKSQIGWLTRNCMNLPRQLTLSQTLPPYPITQTLATNPHPPSLTPLLAVA